MNGIDRLLHLKYASLYDYARPRLPRKVYEFACKYLAFAPKRVADLGCGTGLSAEIWTDHGCDVIGVDIQENMLNMARKKHLKGAKFLLSDAAETPSRRDGQTLLCVLNPFTG